jgi:hypothetical protein
LNRENYLKFAKKTEQKKNNKTVFCKKLAVKTVSARSYLQPTACFALSPPCAAGSICRLLWRPSPSAADSLASSRRSLRDRRMKSDGRALLSPGQKPTRAVTLENPSHQNRSRPRSLCSTLPWRRLEETTERTAAGGFPPATGDELVAGEPLPTFSLLFLFRPAPNSWSHRRRAAVARLFWRLDPPATEPRGRCPAGDGEHHHGGGSPLCSSFSLAKPPAAGGLCGVCGVRAESAPASVHGGGRWHALCPRKGLSLSAVVGQAPPLPMFFDRRLGLPMRVGSRGTARPCGGALCRRSGEFSLLFFYDFLWRSLVLWVGIAFTERSRP